MIDELPAAFVQPKPDKDDAPLKRDIHWAARIQRTRFIIRRYWWLAIVACMAGMITQACRSYRAAPHYYSTARMIMNGKLNISAQEGAYNEELDNFYGTQVALMQSSATINRANDRITSAHPEVHPDTDAVVEATIEPHTAIFDLKVTSNNSDYAKYMVDAIMDTYLDDKRSRKTQTMDESLAAITTDEVRLRKDIADDNAALLDFEKSNNVVFIQETSNSSANMLSGLNGDLSHLQKERDLLTMENTDPHLSVDLPANNDKQTIITVNPTPNSNGGTSATATGTDANGTTATVTGTVSDTVRAGGANDIATQQNEIDRLKIERNDLGAYLQDDHPKMVDLTQQIDRAEKFLGILKARNLDDRTTRVEDLNLQIESLKKQIATVNESSLKLGESLAVYNQLKSKLDRDQSLYGQMASNVQSVDFNKTLDQEEIGILDGSSPSRVIPPNTPMRLLQGFFAGLFAGIALIFLVGRFDDRISSPMEVEENSRFPVIGQIPLVSTEDEGSRAPLLSEHDDRHEMLEYIRHLRSSVIAALGFTDAGSSKSLMVTSAAPNEGKSSVVSNLAIVFAHSGLKVLLVDADLRKGVMHELFELEDTPGMSGFLQHQAKLSECIQHTQVPNLSAIPRGKVFLRAGDLLMGNAIKDLIDEAKAMGYNLILIDTPPLLAAHDAANLCPKVDGTLFVSRVRTSSIRAMRLALDELSQKGAHIIGLVVNAVEPHQPGYFEKYRYKDYYEVEEI